MCTHTISSRVRKWFRRSRPPSSDPTATRGAVVEEADTARPGRATEAQIEEHHTAHGAGVLSERVDGGTVADSGRQAFPQFTPVGTITDRDGRALQVQNLHDGMMSPDGSAATPSIIRTQTFPIDGTQDREPTTVSLKPLTTPEDEEDTYEVSITSPQFTAPSRRSNAKSQVYHTDVTNAIFPLTIQCCLDVTFEETERFGGPRIIPDFVWHDIKSYEKITTAIKEIKQEFVEKSIAKSSDEIYLRYASFFVKGKRNQSLHDMEDSVLIHEKDIEEALPEFAIQAICGFIHSHPCQLFELRIHCDYSAIDRPFTIGGGLSSWPPERLPFHSAIQDEYETKMKIGRPTIQKQRYLSPADHKVLITPENAKRIIEEDAVSSQKLTLEEKAALVQELKSRPASFLQAACVFRGLSMRFLYHLLFGASHIEQRCSDNLETLQLNAPVVCRDELCAKYFDRLSEHIHQFFPEIIRYDLELSRKDVRAVVPVRYGEERVHLGSGGFGNVYEVDLDPHCQLLSPDTKRTYALKQFDPTSRTSKMQGAFDREIKMLLRLAHFPPHDHVLTHINSWEQGGVYYILYEKAHGNLREHMRSCLGGVLTYERTLWFFYQLRGLSDAVRRIHMFREPDYNHVTGSVNLKKTGVVGRHHDIKPENILTFDLPEDLPTLKLSDFGAGKFTGVKDQKDSGPTASAARFTRTYAGPESHRAMREAGEKITRPFDVWALGCVFLELLLWFLGITFPDGRLRFEDMRLDKAYNPDQEDDDYFWRRRISGEFQLNKAVEYVLGMLQKKCKNMQPFQDLIELIRQMLSIMPKSRIKALQLYNALDATFIKAKAELDTSSECYLIVYETNKDLDTGSIAPVGHLSNLLNVGRMEEDISITSVSRAESASNLSDLDVAAEPQPEDSLAVVTGVHESGSQFLGAALHLDTHAPPPLDSGDADTNDAVYMRPSLSRPGLLEQIEQDSKQFQDRA